MTVLLKTTYRYAAALALMNCMAAAVGVTALALTGGLTGEHIAAAIAALRGPITPSQVSPSGTAPTEGAEKAHGELPVPSIARRSDDPQMEIDILQMEAKRIKTELDQRLALNNSILLKVQAEREAVQSEREALKNERQALTKRSGDEQQVRRDEGFERQVVLIEKLSPKVAVQHLLAMRDPEAAAEILVRVAPDRATKIIEAAKKGPELMQMQEIMQRVRDAAPLEKPPSGQDG